MNNINFITQLGCPLALRSDYGTENCTLAALHIAMRSSHEPNAARSCYIYGPSKRNIVC